MIPHFDELQISKVKQLLSIPRKIVITTHHKPDGDALGSSLGLMNYLMEKGHSVQMVSPSEFPPFLNWMKRSIEVIDFIRKPKPANVAFAEAEIIFCLDFNDPRRVERMQSLLETSKGVKILIDHHLDPVPFCDFTFSFPQACATAEIVFHFIKSMGDEPLISKEIAECLYAGIMTDTGSFRFDSVSPDTHTVLSSLLSKGVKTSLIHEYIYDSYSEMRLRFLGYCLSQKLKVFPEYYAAYISCTKEEMDRYKHQAGDLEGVVNFALSIEGIKMAALFSERDGMVKISFRSKGDFSVKELAEQNFEGGGHKNAAGGRSQLSLDDTTKKFESLLPAYKNRLND